MELSYIFSKESFSYISGNGNSEKIPYISGNKTFLYLKTESNFHISGSKFSSLKIFLFWEVELSSPKLKKSFIFQEGT